MKVAAVVVTHNRCELLSQCLVALFAQDCRVDCVIVIDNASTDGTEQAMDRLQATEAKLCYVRLAVNVGGAGGFATGMREAYRLGADWLWLMDDDTIVSPDALTHLLVAVTNVPNVGFACSRVVWKDGSVHRMNLPGIQPLSNSDEPFNSYDPYFHVIACSFVSVLIARRAVHAVGLPYKEFFIRGDDIEYTMRITRAGFAGLYVGTSIAKHLTPNNYSSIDWDHVPETDAWKYCHDIRNQLFMIKRQGTGRYLRRLRKMLFFAFKLRVSYPPRPALARAIFSGAIASIKFNPTIEYVD